MRRMPRAALLAVLALFLGLRDARAQGEDAIPLAGGTLRIGIGPDWSHWSERFGRGTPGFSTGAREPLGIDFSSDSLGVAQLPFLADAQARLRSVTGLAGLSLNLGRAQLTLNNSVRVVPLSAELALSRRLGLRVMLPIVRARVEAFLLGPDSAAAHRGNVGINPALATPGTLDGFRSEVDAALAALQQQAASGPAGLRAQATAIYNSIQPLLCALYTLGGGNAASGSSPCFVATGVLQSPVLPLDTSAAGDSIVARLTAAETSYQNLRAQYAAAGVAIPALTAAYALPSAGLDSAGVRAVFAGPGGAVAGDSLTSIVRTRLGNVELGGWYQIADGARFRSQVALTLRLPTATEDSPHNAIDLGTGVHALGWDVALRNDLVLRPDFWLHAGVRLAGWSSTELVRRVGPANLLILPIGDTATVRRSPGRIMAIDLVPNWQLDDAFRLGVGLHWLHQGAASHEYVTPGDEARIGLPASVLNEETSISALRLGAGMTFATVDRYARGRASLPYTVTVAFNRTFSGSGGKVPAASSFSLLLKLYVNL